LAYVEGNGKEDIWRAKLSGTTQERAATRFLSSPGAQFAPDYSPDGKRIAFVSGRGGGEEIWVCDCEGLNWVPMTSFGGHTNCPRWSPDGQQIAFDARVKGNAAIYLVSAQGGRPQPLTSGDFEEQCPCWSRDGQWVYFDSNRSGTHQLWKVRPRGGTPVQAMWNGGGMPHESKDGKFVYYARDSAGPSIWKAPVLGGEEALPVLGARAVSLAGSPMGDRPFLAASALIAADGCKVCEIPKTSVSWALVETETQRGIYFIDTAKPTAIKFFDFGTGTVKHVTEFVKEPVGQDAVEICVSPDGQWLLFCQGEGSSSIMLVENFR
jgi:WD40 repeat protein